MNKELQVGLGLFLSLFVGIVLGMAFCALASVPPEVDHPFEMSVRTINEHGGLQGFLGLPIGQAAVVEGEILDEKSPHFPREKAYEGREVLQVQRVNGYDRKTLRCMLFDYDPRMKGKKLSGKVTVKCYETGGYEGVNFSTYTKDDLQPAGMDFHFATLLVIYGQP